jgi:hypothetical protein
MLRASDVAATDFAAAAAQDGTGSGDVDTSEVQKLNEGSLAGVKGSGKLRVNPDWQNPSGTAGLRCQRMCACSSYRPIHACSGGPAKCLTNVLPEHSCQATSRSSRIEAIRSSMVPLHPKGEISALSTFPIRRLARGRQARVRAVPRRPREAHQGGAQKAVRRGAARRADGRHCRRRRSAKGRQLSTQQPFITPDTRRLKSSLRLQAHHPTTCSVCNLHWARWSAPHGDHHIYYRAPRRRTRSSGRSWRSAPHCCASWTRNLKTSVRCSMV